MSNPARIEIRPATGADLDELTEIALRAKRHWGYPDAWIEEWRNQLRPQPASLAAGHVFGAVLEARWAGWYAIDPREEPVDLAHLWVLPEHMGRGIGRMLFEHAAIEAKRRGSRQLEIVSDPHAERFYERMGARRTRTVAAPVAGQARRLPVLVFTLSTG